MHRAPAVSFPVVRSRVHLRCIVVLQLLACSGLALWVVHDGTWLWRHSVLLVCIGFAGGVAVRDWARTPDGLLCWDGGQWLWRTAQSDQPCVVQRLLDLQSAVVVRVTSPEGMDAHRWLDAASAPTQWLALRRAIVSGALHPLEQDFPTIGTKPEGRA